MSSPVHPISDPVTDSLAHGKTERLLTVAELAAWLGVSKAWCVITPPANNPSFPVEMAGCCQISADLKGDVYD